MHREPERAWGVESLAAAAGMSRSPFAAKFTRLVGVSPLAYLTGWRMQTAARLLSDRDLALAEVAARVGYESEAAFGKAFKRHYAVAPGAYRRERPRRVAAHVEESRPGARPARDAAGRTRAR